MRVGVWFLGMVGCLGNVSCFLDVGRCAVVEESALDLIPAKLSESGLFNDMGTEELGAGVHPYAPRFELESDGASKRRWIQLPAFFKIDTDKMDAWQFPVGTRFFKEFTRGDTRVETRLLQKTGDGAEGWVAMAYLWNKEQTDATPVLEGKENASGTKHDVPPATLCMGCHGGVESRVLGFSAVQLPWEGEGGGLGIADLVRQDLVTTEPDDDLEVPGDETEREALGYLHANCGHCHNQARPQWVDNARCFDPMRAFDLSLRSSLLGSVDDTGVYRTALDRFRGGHMHSAEAIHMMKKDEMPALGTEQPDEEGIALLRRWAADLPAE